jgi:oligopeptide transport system permease protein
VNETGIVTAIDSTSTSISARPVALDAPPDHLWRQLCGSRRVLLGGTGMLIVMLFCIFSLYWTGFRPASGIYYNNQHGNLVRTLPSVQSAWRWFGTDGQARSLLGRCMFGGVISLAIGFASAAISVVLGVSVGLIAGYRGGWTDAALMRFVDVLYGLPYILLVILFRVAFATANSVVVLFMAIGLVSWLTMARVIRGQVLSLRSQPFVEAARAAGLTELRIFTRHLLPNLVGPIIVYTTLIIPAAILQESFLSFLGVGIQAPLPTWGSLASDGLLPALNTVHSDWWLLLFPCTLLAIMLLCLNFLGDGLRDVFDPKKEAAKI